MNSRGCTQIHFILGNTKTGLRGVRFFAVEIDLNWGLNHSDTSIYSPGVIICKRRVFHHHIIIREQELKIFGFRIYIKRDPADERVVRPEHNFLKAIFIQGRLKDLIAFFVMPKEGDQFGAAQRPYCFLRDAQRRGPVCSLPYRCRRHSGERGTRIGRFWQKIHRPE